MFFRRHGYTPVPRLVQWMATLRCPLRCPHCLAAGNGQRPADMPLESALPLVDQVADMGVDEFLVTGGEPLAREDLGEVIRHLARRGVSWSLNTAVMPPAALRGVLAEHPPQFVAVSLDGPAAVHDGFRGRDGAFEEALEAIRFFSGLGGCDVTAGTTVGRHNYAALRETFRIVTGSAATAWGIHLVFPEGRAAGRTDLRLSRGQLKRLLRFVARMRKYFPVTLADEMGYCGDWEPLVRDRPLTCGAGRAQCVVLPDGEVVPCTTLDRTTSAGNLHERPLARIWRDGFADLRAWRPAGRCARCEYAVACQGGCWLQRRAGAHCYRDVWHVPAALKTAAGVAVCLGMLHGAAPQSAAERTRIRPPAAAQPLTPTAGATTIESHILAWQSRTLHTPGVKLPLAPPVPKELADDPAFIYLKTVQDGKLPEDLDGRAKAIREALKTRQVSLSLSALLWRSLAEWCLDGPPPEQRTDVQRRTLRQTLAALRAATERWRAQVCRLRLDPYLARGGRHELTFGERCKAYRPAPPWVSLVRDTAEERWGAPPAKGGWVRPHGPKPPVKPQPSEQAVREFLARHPHAEHMRLSLHAEVSAGLTRLGGARPGPLKAEDFVGVFDVIGVPAADNRIDVLLFTAQCEWRVRIRLPGGTELTYADLLGIYDQQHRLQLGERAGCIPARRGGSRTALPQTDPLLLPRMRQAAKAALARKAGPIGRKTIRRWFPYTVHWWLADFWLF
jgi:radical SAM protein with 4Fe4S-binding SPASM domain